MAERRVDKDKPLNERERKFVAAYIRLGVGKAAAIEAGWSPNGAEAVASRKLKMPHIKAALEKAREEAAKTLGIDAAFILGKAIEIIASCTQKVPVVDMAGNQKVDKDGKPVFKMLDPSTARNALQDVAKWVGMGEEKEETKSKAGGVLLVPPVPSEAEWSKQHGQ